MSAVFIVFCILNSVTGESVFKISPRSKTVTEGNPQVLDCHVTKGSAHWYKGDERLNLNTDSSRDRPYLLKPAPGKFNLFFRSVKFEDDGLYRCASTEFPTQIREANLTVFVQPNKMYFDGLINRPLLRLSSNGDSYKLKCVTENGRLAGRITWFKDDTQIKETSSVSGTMPNSTKFYWVNSTVEIKAPPIGNSETYSCSFQLKDGLVPRKIHIQVIGVTRQRFMFKVQPISQNVREGNSAILNCLVRWGSARWLKDGEPLHPTTDSSTDGAWLSKPEKGAFNLKFNQVKFKDDGLYSCAHKFSESPAEAYLRVFAPPNKMYFDGFKNRASLHLSPNEGSFKLKCVTENGRPPGKITWYKDGVKIKEASSVYDKMPNSKKLYWVNSTVRIKPFPRHSTQTYSCSIQTKYVPAPKRIDIKVTGASVLNDISTDQSHSKPITPPGPFGRRFILGTILPFVGGVIGAVVISGLIAYAVYRMKKHRSRREIIEEVQSYGDQQFLPHDFVEEDDDDSEEQRESSRRSNNSKRKRQRNRSRTPSD